MLLREWFDDFWQYRFVDWAGAFLDEWCVQVMRSRLEPMKHGRSDAAPPSAAALELVSGARRDFRRDCRGLQQQSETDCQKGIRRSLVSVLGNRPVPYVGSATGAGNDPQILLKTRKKELT